MKIGLKIVFSLLLLCLLALPGSAEEWKLGFENHPNDVWYSENPLDPNYSNPFQLAASGTNSYLASDIRLSSINSINYNSVAINKSFNDYFAFTITSNGTDTGSYSSAFEVILTCMDSNNANLITGKTLVHYNNCTARTIRIEVLRETIAGMFTVYVNGDPADSFFMDTEDMSKIYLMVRGIHQSQSSNNVIHVTLDDFLADSENFDVMLSTDEVHNLGIDPSISLGFVYLPEMTQYLKVYNPGGSVVFSQDITSDAQVFTIPGSSLSPGRYSIRLFQNTGGVSYLLSSEYFIVGSDSSSSLIEFDKDSYYVGDRANVYTHISPYEAGYSIKFVYGSSQYISRDIGNEDEMFSFTIPSTSDNYVFVYIVDSEGDVVSFDQAEIEGKTPDPEMKLDKNSYAPSDSIQVQYWYMPIGTKLTATYYLNGVKKSSSTITINDVIGTEYFTIGGREADSVTISASSDRELYATASASIKYGKYSISGKVYDAVTGSTIPGAIVFTPGFTVETDQLGYYNHSTEPGILNVTVSASGYEDHHTSMYINSLVTTKNFYLTPVLTSETGSSVYGIVSDWYNGSSIGGCYITLKNSSVSYSALTTSKGYYSIEKPDMVGSWTITASKDGYDTYTSTVSISGDTYKGIRLVPSGGAVPDDSDGSDDSDDSGGSDDSDDSDGSGSSTDRPSRAAARDSLDWLEGTMPNLIKLVVVIFVLALIGVKL